MMTSTNFKLLAIFVLQILVLPQIFATHNRSGELLYQQVSDFTIEASIITYTKASSLPADRDSLLINWGDGNSEMLYRVNGPDNDGELIGNDTKYNVYTGIHTYVGLGSYFISMQDPNRNGGILNVNYPSSEAMPFYIESEVILLSDVNGYNESPTLLVPPNDLGFVGTPFLHIPAASDEDGDSLSFELVAPLQDFNLPVSNFIDLVDIAPGPDNNLELDPITGMMVWDAPQMAGEYNIAFLIKSYREGEYVGSVRRDMQIIIYPSLNLLPTITMAGYQSGDVVEVMAGESISLNVSALENESDQNIVMKAFSSTLNYDTNPAVFTFVDNNSNSGDGSFNWTPSIEQAREQPYQVVFKVTDNLGASNFFLCYVKVNGAASPSTEVGSSQDFNIFPNPSKDWITIEKPNQEPIGYQIVNRMGQVCKEGECRGTHAQINVDGLESGLHYFRIGKEIVKSFIKQ